MKIQLYEAKLKIQELRSEQKKINIDKLLYFTDKYLSNKIYNEFTNLFDIQLPSLKEIIKNKNEIDSKFSYSKNEEGFFISLYDKLNLQINDYKIDVNNDICIKFYTCQIKIKNINFLCLYYSINNHLDKFILGIFFDKLILSLMEIKNLKCIQLNEMNYNIKYSLNLNNINCSQISNLIYKLCSISGNSLKKKSKNKYLIIESILKKMNRIEYSKYC